MTDNQAFVLQQIFVGIGWFWVICEAWSTYKELRALKRRRRRKANLTTEGAAKDETHENLKADGYQYDDIQAHRGTIYRLH
jgi:hypothetical protein